MVAVGSDERTGSQNGTPHQALPTKIKLGWTWLALTNAQTFKTYLHFTLLAMGESGFSYTNQQLILHIIHFPVHQLQFYNMLEVAGSDSNKETSLQYGTPLYS
jgi:hypothetical protein